MEFKIHNGGARDLRGWMKLLELEGEFKEIQTKVRPDGEIQEIARQLSARGGPAVLFSNIEGHEETWCSKLVVGNLNSFSKASLALGLPKDTFPTLIVDRVQESLRNLILPTIIDNGPVKQNIITTGIDLNEIPVPMWHPQDGGKYINIWHGVVTKDPDTGEYNLGCYRGMIADKDKIVSLLIRSQHWGQHFSKYCQRGENMPVAYIYGCDPTIMIAAGTSVTTCGKWGEYEWISAMQGESLPLVKCETIDLYVPASAEIVIEGHVLCDPDTYKQEGPFKEASGSYCEPALRPVTQISCITHRDDPIYSGTATGLLPIMEEQKIPSGIGTIAVLKNHLQNAGIPFVDLTMTPFLVVSIKKMWQGHPLQVAYTLLGHKSSNLPVKLLVVVDETVNVWDPNEIFRAINNNTDPIEDVYPLPTNNLIYDTASAEKDCNIEEYGASIGNKLFIDATINWKRHPKKERWEGGRVPASEGPPEKDVKKVMRRWKDYGFGQY